MSGFVFLVALVFFGRSANRGFSEGFRLSVENESLTRGLNVTQLRLEGALDSMSDAFGLFDSDDNLIEMNDKFRRLIPPQESNSIHPMTYDRFIRHLAESGQIRDFVGRSESWVEEFVQLRETGSMPIEIAMVDGTWLLLNDEPTDDGGTVTTLSE